MTNFLLDFLKVTVTKTIEHTTFKLEGKAAAVAILGTTATLSTAVVLTMRERTKQMRLAAERGIPDENLLDESDKTVVPKID